MSWGDWLIVVVFMTLLVVTLVIVLMEITGVSIIVLLAIGWGALFIGIGIKYILAYCFGTTAQKR